MGNVVRKPPKVPKARRAKVATPVEAIAPSDAAPPAEAVQPSDHAEPAADVDDGESEAEDAGEPDVPDNATAPTPAIANVHEGESPRDDDVDMVPADESATRRHVCHGGNVEFCKNTDSAPLSMHQCYNECGLFVHHLCAKELEEGQCRYYCNDCYVRLSSLPASSASSSAPVTPPRTSSSSKRLVMSCGWISNMYHV